MKFLTIFFIFILVVVPLASANIKYVSLPFKAHSNFFGINSNVEINFQIKDSEGNFLQDALIIIQGISDQSFSKNLFTNAGGEASISLNQNEIFIYTVYKFTYETSTSNFFTTSDKNIELNINKISEDNWYFYYEDNGEIEVQLKSSDEDVNYTPGEYINQVMQIKNVAGENINLIQDKTSVITVDGDTLNRLGWWGNILPSDLSLELLLKPNGWIRATVEGSKFEICMGNAIGKYNGQTFDLSGSEFICKEEDNGVNSQNFVPEWILDNAYRFKMQITYSLRGQEKIFELLTQEIFLKNDEWKPEINSVPETELEIGENWEYDITPKYKKNFIYYKLEGAPSGMTIDSTEGVVNWKPTKSGSYDITVRAYHPYFSNDPRIAYRDQFFILEVLNPNVNLYTDKLYLSEKKVKVGEAVHAKFIVHNEDDKENSFSYSVDKGDGTSIEYALMGIPAGGKRTVYTSWEYSSVGKFIPKLIIDSKNEVKENNENDNSNGFSEVEVLSNKGILKKYLRRII